MYYLWNPVSRKEESLLRNKGNGVHCDGKFDDTNLNQSKFVQKHFCNHKFQLKGLLHGQDFVFFLYFLIPPSFRAVVFQCQ